MRTDATAASMILVAIVVLTLLAAAVVNVFSIALTDYKDVTAILQGLAAAGAVVLGGLFAWRNSLLFRTFAPHLDISLDVSHRNISANYLHIAVLASLKNSSKVRVEIHEGSCQLLQVSPVEDEVVPELHAQRFAGDANGHVFDYKWTPFPAVPCVSDDEVLIIEPGQTHLETVEFVVRRDVASVLVHCRFENPGAERNPDAPSDWSVVVPYDILTTV